MENPFPSSFAQCHESILIAVSFGIPTVIFAEAGLSFLGLGVNDPIASWGKMVAPVMLMSGSIGTWLFSQLWQLL